STQFEPIDRDELHWWMGRLGVTLRDLLTDSAVRIWLGRALDVRYFAIGKIERDAGLTVTAYLLDSEQGFLASGARVDGRDRHELKLRLAELARLTQMSPPERIQMEKNSAGWRVLLVQVRDLFSQDAWSPCIAAARKALGLRPCSLEVQLILKESERQMDLVALQRTRWGVDGTNNLQRPYLEMKQ